MSGPAQQEIQRKEHQVQRWITALWAAFVVGLALTSIIIAVQAQRDLAGTLGFLVVSSIFIFMLSRIAYLLLYGLSILLEGVEYHKTHCDDRKHFAGMGDFMR